ncbi:MAG: class I SAM-dependent methyltransferase, partial [Bacteroidota bacterium]|nr:class I SAM-dependent methyltransferase [Bacteroidota bacterium]
MYSRTKLALKYLTYSWHASNGRGHGIHSPFVYEFVTEVLNDSRPFYPYIAIEKIRTAMLRDQRTIGFGDYGKTTLVNANVKISDIAHRSLSGRKFGQLLFRIVNHYQPKRLIELGTSLGISGAYLATADPAAFLTTMEGSDSIAKIAAENFSKLRLQNIRQVTGDFDKTLPAVIASSAPFDMVFIDGNHRKDPLLNYFHQFLNKRPRDAI